MTEFPNTLYLPELREMLAEKDAAQLREFCEALHPARTADFMAGLTAQEAWAVLRYAEPLLRAEIFHYFEPDRQIEIVEQGDRAEIAALIGVMPPDDRVDLLEHVRPEVVEELMPLLPADDRRDILRLAAYPEGTAGSMMTSAVARVREGWTVAEALKEIGRQAQELETIYYVYVVDDDDHLRGLVSARQLVSSMGRPETKMADLMESDLVTVNAMDDREEVAQKVARYDLLAIPVVNDEYHLLGIITHDDVIDAVVDEATEDAHLSAAVQPLEESYLETRIVTLTWKRGIWLLVLFFGALLTAIALNGYGAVTREHAWLVLFIPLVISTGGNSGNQSATLIITALSKGDVTLRDWWRVVVRELAMGLLLGSGLGVVGFFYALPLAPHWLAALIMPLTVLLVVLCGTLTGSLLPLLFRRLGLDPAIMSNPFVAGLIDVIGIVIFMNVAAALL